MKPDDGGRAVGDPAMRSRMGGRCPLTGITDLTLLRAFNQQRLDVPEPTPSTVGRRFRPGPRQLRR